MTRPFIITVFGAESVGKTTFSRQLADTLDGIWSCEFARGYLEATGQDVTGQSMHAIWQGQAALQRTSQHQPAHYVVQDTDLFSTIGYWQLPHVEPVIGPCPKALTHEALSLRSDLYLILQSNIPFEHDRLRYGGDRRESTDQYWIDICEAYGLPYIIIEASERSERIHEATRALKERSHLCVA